MITRKRGASTDMILLTGGSGFVGSAVLAELLRRRLRVRVLSRSERPLPAGAELCRGDLLDASALAVALRAVNCVIHLAGAVDGDAERLHRVNVEGSRRLATAARAARVGWFVHMSSAGVYGDTVGCAARSEDAVLAAASPYELSKKAGEAAVVALLNAGPTGCVVLRPAGVYGGARHATQQFLRGVQSRRVWMRAPPAVIVHPTYVDDVVQAVIGCLDRRDLRGEIFNVGGERALSLDDWVQAAADALSRRLVKLAVPAPVVNVPARSLYRLGQALRLRVPARLERARHRVLSRALDTTKARTTLGVVPVPLERALSQTIETARLLGAL